MNNEINLSKVRDKLKVHKSRIRELLRTHGVEVSDNTFETLIQEISVLHIVSGRDNYLVHNIDGYVNKVVQFQPEQLFKGDLPNDIQDGYYQIIDGKVIVDEKRREELLSLD